MAQKQGTKLKNRRLTVWMTSGFGIDFEENTWQFNGMFILHPFFLSKTYELHLREKSPEASYFFSLDSWNLELDYTMTFCATDLQIDFNSAVNRWQFIFQIKSNKILLQTEKKITRTGFNVRWLKPNWYIITLSVAVYSRIWFVFESSVSSTKWPIFCCFFFRFFFFVCFDWTH